MPEPRKRASARKTTPSAPSAAGVRGPKLPQLSPRTLKLIITMLLAALAAGGFITIPDHGNAPAPAASSHRSYGTGGESHKPRAAAAAPAATGKLVGDVETHLAQPGDTQPTFMPRASTSPLPGCVSRFNTHNFSSRAGVKVRDLVAHYTVSPNVAGWADVNGNADFLNLVSTDASTGAIVDAEGHCLYTVPLALKAWTEAGGNPFSFAIEFVGTGSEGHLSSAALKEGARIFAYVAKREGIPIQLGNVTSCQPVKPGIVDHAMYGACGGGHHDIRPYYGTNAVRQTAEDHRALDPLIAATKAAAAPKDPLTKTERANVNLLEHERAIAKRHGGWGKVAPIHLANANKAKAALQATLKTLRRFVAKDGWTARRHARAAALTAAI